LFIGYTAHNVFGFSLDEGPLLLASFNSALFSAALNEELAKLIFILTGIIIFRKNIKNVYEYIIIGGAVGFGFTIVEEYIYGSGIIPLILRTLTITSHMMMGFAMGRHLGLARYNKVTGKGSVWKEYLLAYFVPVAVHTIYDTLAVNKLITAEDELTKVFGIIMVVVAIVLAFALQVYVFKRLRKNAGTLTALSVLQNR
jgi:RsiW-degrading membrane proteinase PrsW (M82 family)